MIESYPNLYQKPIENLDSELNKTKFNEIIPGQIIAILSAIIGGVILSYVMIKFISDPALRAINKLYILVFALYFVVFAIFIDYIVWQYLPNTEGLIGLTMVISAGVLIAIRERSLIR